MAPAQIPVLLTQKPSTENGINRATTLFLAWMAGGRLIPVNCHGIYHRYNHGAFTSSLVFHPDIIIVYKKLRTSGDQGLIIIGVNIF